MNVDNAKEFKHLSLCTGYGGIDLGLKRALGNVRSIAYVEIEAFAVANLVAKMEKGFLDPAPIWTDLKTINWRLFCRKVDILSGGFPCQPFSASGRREADQDGRHLFPYIKRGIEIIRPSFVFLENVEGIISSKLKGNSWKDPEGTSVLLHVLRELERIDYKATFGIFSASETGAPHQRKRVFILGINNELTESSLDYVSELVKKSKPRETAYPATRGREQYFYEPPRVTLGNSSDRYKTNDIKQKILSSKTADRKTTRSEWTSDFRKMDDSDCKRLLRDRNETSNSEQKRRKEQTRHNAKTNPSSRGLQREIKSEMGGDADGSSDRLDYADLYRSFDSRTDELRMLGNGVVPSTARTAFVTMWNELTKQ